MTLSYPISRRTFAQRASTLAAATALPSAFRWDRDTYPTIIRRGADVETRGLAVDPDADHIRAVLLRAVDAAKSAGASYADARVVRVIDQSVVSRRSAVMTVDWRMSRFGDERFPMMEETERHAISVRALVDGTWGFTASPWWTEDEAAALAHDAVAQARDNAQWVKNKVELAPAPVVTGTWTTPFRIDPFAVPVEEKMEVLMRAEEVYRPVYRALDHTQDAGFLGLSCHHITRALATSEGTFTTQHFYTTALGRRWAQAQLNGLDVQGDRRDHPGWRKDWGNSTNLDDVPVPPGTGWEAITDADLWTLGQEAGDMLYARLLGTGKAPSPKAVNVGQYTIVMDAATVGRLLDVTIGQASDFDRITGIEANAGGTSYLGTDPLQLLGRYSFGSPLLTVTTTRAGSVGAVKHLPAAQWDDEGVVHTPFTMVKDGVLQEIPTTRDRAPRLASYDATHGRAAVSNGCAASGNGFGLELTTVNPPTLVMQPATQEVALNDLVASVPRGLMFSNGNIRADFQGRQLMVSGDVQEITNGRLGAPVAGATILADAAEVWKRLTAIGGARAAAAVTGTWSKGVPAQELTTAAVAVPAVFRELAVVNGGRL